MITDEQLRWIALFFLFTLLEEKSAVAASETTAALIKAQPPRGPLVEESARRVALIRILKKTFDQSRKSLPRNRVVPNADSDLWQWPVGLDSQSWIRFQKSSDDGEVIAVVLSRILRFADYEIAEGLNVSIGTARYRIGKGMRALGTNLLAVGATSGR